MKILITGMGIISALGNNVEENLQALRESRSGIAPLHYLKTSHTEFPVGEVKMTNTEMIRLLNLSEKKPTIRTALMGMLAAREALQNARLLDMRQLDMRYETENNLKSQISILNSQISTLNSQSLESPSFQEPP